MKRYDPDGVAERTSDVQAVIGTRVVHDDHFDIIPSLLQDAAKRRAQEVCVVMAGNDDAERRFAGVGHDD
jgi:hypothetical protein